MNIVGKPGYTMTNFMPAEDYFFGDPNKVVGTEQGGIYWRNLVGFRIENITESELTKLHLFYKNLSHLESEGQAGYSMFSFLYIT
eukprot:UN08810